MLYCFVRKPKAFIMFVFTLLCCCLVFFSLAASAAPADEAAEKGWVEFKATVPDGFLAPVEVELQCGTEFKTVYIIAENDYILRTQLPYGGYDVMNVRVSNDTKMRYPTEWAPYYFEVKDSKAAVSVSIKVSDPGNYNPFGTNETVDSDTTDPEAATDPEIVLSPEPSEPPVSDDTLSQDDEVLPTPETEVSEDTSEPVESSNFFNDLLTEFFVSVVCALVFGGLVFGICFLVRKYRENNS